MRKQAARRPGDWVYAIDPYFDPAGRVPGYGVIGAWKVDNRGRIEGAFVSNPKYRPSPRSLGFAAPADPVENQIQLEYAGYASRGDVCRSLATSTVFLAPWLFERETLNDSNFFVAIYTSRMHVPGTMSDAQLTSVLDLIPKLPDGAILRVNPNSIPSVDLPVHDIKGCVE
ncbi:type VII secretion system-associated protein [Streptomyces sp. NPDC057375]|uniref:type VII secretion system-associated protein n=1 Tax=Streptomyces sp. NPDC057375 TaxID=3346109 RepID=UPI00363715F5